MNRDVLMISTMEGAENCARAMEEQVQTRVEVAVGRKAGLLALRREEFGVVVVEENLVEGDPAWAEQVWAMSGLAMPLQVNFSISGSDAAGAGGEGGAEPEGWRTGCREKSGGAGDGERSEVVGDGAAAGERAGTAGAGGSGGSAA